MSDSEAYAKIAFILAVVLGVIALGYVMVFVVAPLLLLAVIIDFGMRQSYNAKLVKVIEQSDLNEVPHIHSFEARMVDQQVLIAWIADLPNDSHLEIYRVSGHGGGSVGDLEARGVCIHSTTREVTGSKDELFIDMGVAEGLHFYVPVVSGRSVEREPLPYQFLGFSKEVQFRTRRRNVVLRGEAFAVNVAPAVVAALSDTRDLPSRIADDVKVQIKQSRQFAANLNDAIAGIMSDDDLTEDEKQLAVELLETRADLT
ncbi:hypothetical protein QTO30_20100 [Yoonia sp. GPGPB17]|uniref:hypothetical protein n=1 Tax=Yoonia sp. GPGPB17 TaxID=3026147 RepID=UPI0030C0F0A7